MGSLRRIAELKRGKVLVAAKHPEKYRAAASTGLNPQPTDTIVNADLPWNPAMLEERIARGQFP